MVIKIPITARIIIMVTRVGIAIVIVVIVKVVKDVAVIV
jgi:hypothetical protein